MFVDGEVSTRLSSNYSLGVHDFCNTYVRFKRDYNQWTFRNTKHTHTKEKVFNDLKGPETDLLNGHT